MPVRAEDPNSRAEPVSASESSFPVIYFDGVCGLCNRFVDLLLRADRQGVLRFAPLQGETAHERLGQGAAPSLETIVLMDREGTFRRSDAVLRSMAHLGGAWRMIGVLRLIPRSIRNLGYDVIAANRYRWFGKRDSCRVPTAKERERFLP